MMAESSASVPLLSNERASEKAAIAALIASAIAREDFEICVVYRQYKKCLEEVDSAIAKEEFEKCVELRNKKKEMEAAHPEIGRKRDELQATLLSPRGGKAPDGTDSDSESLVKGVMSKKAFIVDSGGATSTSTGRAGTYAASTDRASERAQKALEERQKQAERDAKWAKFAPKLAGGAALAEQARDDTAVVGKSGAEPSDSEGDAAPTVVAKPGKASVVTAKNNDGDKPSLDESTEESNVEVKKDKKKKKVKKSGDEAAEGKKRKKKKPAANLMRTTWGGGGALTSTKVRFGNVETKRVEATAPRFRNEWLTDGSADAGTEGALRVSKFAHTRNPNDTSPKLSRAADVPEPGVVKVVPPKPGQQQSPAAVEKKHSFVKALFSINKTKAPSPARK